MRFLSLIPMLQSADMARTRAFWCDVLGFSCTGAMEGWMRLERDGAAIMFMRNEHLGPPQATATQYIRVDDVLAVWESIRDRVAAEWGPEDYDYGMREFAIRDPDGYLVSFGQELPAPDATKG